MKINELSVKDRVQLHPCTDLWMMGARYGTITEVGRKHVRVHLDRLGRSRVLNPELIGEVVPYAL